MMAEIFTNPHLSSVAAACLSREIAHAESPEVLRACAKKRVPYLIGKDKDRMRDAYVQRLRELKNV